MLCIDENEWATGAYIDIYEDWWILKIHCGAKRERERVDIMILYTWS